MRPNRIAKMIFLFIVLAPIAIFLFGWIIMSLWNNVLVPVLNVHPVTFWQGLGILVLSKIRFSSFGGGRNRSYGDHWKQRMMWRQMSPEQREQFKEKLRSRARKWGYMDHDSHSDTDTAVNPS